MVIKFEVGKVYFSEDAVWKSNGDVGYKKNYYLCVKRNDSTKYVSFKPIYKGQLLNSQESRKAEIDDPRWYGNSGEPCERVSIGYGGSGSWKNWHNIYARNLKK